MRKTTLARSIASVVAVAALAGCSSLPVTLPWGSSSANAHTNSDTAVQETAAKLAQIGGPSGWTVRTNEIHALHFGTTDGTAQTLTSGATPVHLRLGDKQYSAYAAWTSPTVDPANSDAVTSICGQFADWAMKAGKSTGSTQFASHGFWVSDCTNALLDQKVQGEKVWFDEPASTNPTNTFLSAAVINHKGADTTITAVLGLDYGIYAG